MTLGRPQQLCTTPVPRESVRPIALPQNMPSTRSKTEKKRRELRALRIEARYRMLAHAQDNEARARAKRVASLSDVQLQLRIQLWDVIHYRRSLYGRRCCSLRAFFKAVDQKKKGFVGHDDFREALVRLDVGSTLPQLNCLLRTMDSDGDGTVCFSEFVSWMRGETARKDFDYEGELDAMDAQDQQENRPAEPTVSTGRVSSGDPKWMVWAPELIYDDEYAFVRLIVHA